MYRCQRLSYRGMGLAASGEALPRCWVWSPGRCGAQVVGWMARVFLYAYRNVLYRN
jgi:hypothetical protein